MSDRRMQSSRDDRRRDRDGDRGDRRRRSRSPNHRHRGGEENSYESSRNYREREREQRYGGNERRNYDRGDRRDMRRDDDRRDSRRDRDLFADRRGPREDNRQNGEREQDRARDRDDMRQMERQTRQKSASPAPRKPKEPTPDLTDVPSVLIRKRRLTQWDIKPPGYESVTAEQAKLSGMFPLPGAPRAQPIDQSRLQAFMAQPQNQVSAHALKPSTARQSKRVFISNVPASATDSSLADFFNLQLNGLNITKGNDPCVSAAITTDRTTAMVEFKTPEDATNAVALNGILMEPEAMDTSNGSGNDTASGLQIRRPKDYIVPIVSDETQNEAGLLSRNVPDTQNKIAITSVPIYLSEDQIQELLQSFGELRNFVLAKEQSTDHSRGFAFCEYMEASVTDAAVEALNGMELGDAKLKVQKACIGIQQVDGEISVNAMSLMAGSVSKDAESGRVLCLMNMITPEELLDADEADEILEDVKEECSKYGPVIDTKMPRPTHGNRGNNGIGKIYIKYEDSASAQKALAALAGRKFADRTVVVTFFSEEYFDVSAW